MKKKFLISLLLVIAILTTIFDTVYATDEQTEIPTKYDLRDEITIIPEKQISSSHITGPSCYSYTKTKMVETYLQKTKEINYNLSETYYAYHGEEKENVFVLESDFPNKMFSQISNIDQKIEEVSKKAVINKFEYLSITNKNQNTVKRYIQKYGGIPASTNSDTQWSNYKGGIYHKELYNGNPHEIVIIGWDDNYSKDNFVYEKPENDGAWLVLNSWGSNWGNNGTGWVSYEDSYDMFGSMEFIKSITLSDGEKIETKLEDKKQEEIKETETPVIEQETTEPNKTSNIQNIFIIVFAVAIILLIIGITLNLKKHK